MGCADKYSLEYKLPLTVRVAGGWVRDKVNKHLIKILYKYLIRKWK